MSRTLFTFLLLGGMFGAGLAPVNAPAQDDDDSFDRTPQSCVVMNRVRRTEVLDDRTVLFHLRDDRILRNHLPNECPNLEREDRFSYQARGGRLCDTDTITVLPRGVGAFGATCRLGRFYPMSQEDLEELMEGPSRIEAVPVEPPDED